MKVRDALARGVEELDRAGVPDARLESEVLVRHALGIDRTMFFAMLNDELPQNCESTLHGYFARRKAREPLAYITGHREFYGLELRVTPAVLVPRPETEMLVEHTLEFIRQRGASVQVADICTGSGAIAIAIAHSARDATVIGTDISYEALEVAEANRRSHGVADRVYLYHGDLLDAVGGTVDVIVSNPPYLRSASIDGLAPEVRQEPRLALDGGPDGAVLIRKLFAQASKKLKPGGMLMCELDPEQAEEVSALGRLRFPGASVTCEQDLSGLTRAVKVCLPLHSEAR